MHIIFFETFDLQNICDSVPLICLCCFFCCTVRFLLISPVLFSRYKVGRIEQMESANQAKARGSNSVSVMYCNEPQFCISFECCIDSSPLSQWRMQASCVYPFRICFSLLACPKLYGYNSRVRVRFCFNVHRVMYTVILCPSILAETGNFVLLMTQFWHSGFNWQLYTLRNTRTEPLPV